MQTDHDTHSAGTIDVVDGVVLNTSIVHPSTMNLDGQEEVAPREIFARLSTISRANVCCRLTGELGLVEDSAVYGEFYREELSKLQLHARVGAN